MPRSSSPTVKAAVLAVNVTKFRAVGVVLTSATFSLVSGDPDYFHTDGVNIWITIPKGAPKNLDIEIAFQTDASQYLLIGIAFNKTQFDPGVEGALEFPFIGISRLEQANAPMNAISELRVKDAHVKDRMGVNYDYYLMLQEVASGSIGVIDPPIDTQGGN